MTTTAAGSALPPAYEPASVESRVYAMWEEAGYFQPRIDPERKPYCIIMPPPNVTGELHLGHGLEDSITDVLVRWHRMQGDPTLWLPGEDHAGIATQNVIERELGKEGLSRQDLGREAFVERTWMWVRKYRSRIADQHRKLGASADWSRDVFTLDPQIVKAVRTTFVNLYKQGLIYRGLRMINWCPRCETALSDLEVDHVEEPGKLYFVRYPIVGEGGMPLPDYVTVATTRPETMVADTAVAVNPADERYEEQIGRMLLLPIIGREIPVVADDAVKPEFGTGAVKVTPGHDPNDWEIGQRHDLPVIVAIDLQARMNDEAGPYAGMPVDDARAAIVRDLEDEGFLDHVEDFVHSVGHCSRCKTVVQPLPSEQWWVAVTKEYTAGHSLAGDAAAAVRDGRIRIVPQRFEKVYLNWMDNIRDWCISRQLWWGHQIPVWYCENKHTICQVDDPSACPECGAGGAAGPGRARHVVLFGAGDARGPGLAGRQRGAALLLPNQRHADGLRHHVLLVRQDDHVRALQHARPGSGKRGAVPDGAVPRADSRRQRRQDDEVARQRGGPAHLGGDVRGRRVPLRGAYGRRHGRRSALPG